MQRIRARAVLGSALLAVVLAGLPAPVGAADAPGVDRLLLADAADGHVVWVADGDGTDLRQLPLPEIALPTATFSADGDLLALHVRTGLGRLEITYDDGTCLVELPPTTRYQGSPSFRPGGDVLAYTSFLIDGRDLVEGRLELFDPSTGDVETVADGQGPDWSPGGDELVYVDKAFYAGSEGPLHAIAPDGTGDRDLGVEGAYPTWSPDGTQIAYLVDGDVMVVPAAGGAGSPVTTTGDAGWPFWSSDVNGASQAVGIAAAPSGAGAWVTTAEGSVQPVGAVPVPGSMSGQRLHRPVVGIAPAGDDGYWLVASDGGVFAFGDAGFFGSTGGMVLDAPVVGMAASPSGEGYWLLAADRGVLGFGDAPFRGSGVNGALVDAAVGLAG